MIRESKIWGERWCLHQDSTHTTNILKLKADFRCSWHSHKTKWNLFAVISGSVGIKTIDGETILGPGESFTVAPGEMHEFRVHEDSVMVEEMYVEYDDDDIDRENVGGKMEDAR